MRESFYRYGWSTPQHQIFGTNWVQMKQQHNRWLPVNTTDTHHTSADTPDYISRRTILPQQTQQAVPVTHTHTHTPIHTHTDTHPSTSKDMPVYTSDTPVYINNIPIYNSDTQFYINRHSILHQ
jgi:hypothetical protein